MELSFLLWIQETLQCGFTDWFFPTVTTLGDKGLIWLTIAAAMLISRKYRKWGVAMVCAMAVTALTGEVILKHLIQRPRPFTEIAGLELLIPPPSSYSFPSGHSASSFTAATVLLLCRKRFGIPALILASLIAFSRMFLFVHYPHRRIGRNLFGCFLCTSYLLPVEKIQISETRINHIKNTGAFSL